MSLFAHYPADPGLIRACAEDLFVGSSRVWNVGSAVAGRHDGAVAAVDGLLTTPVSLAVLPVSQAAGFVSAAATVAGGALEQFAAAVATYDVGVDELNRRYEAAQAAGFYVDPVTAAPGESLTVADQQRYDDRVFAARAQLMFDLGAEEARLRADLDAAAEITAAVLHRGPTPESVRFLAASNAFPTTTGLILASFGSDDDHTDVWAPGPIEAEFNPYEDDDDDPPGPDWLHDAAGAVKDGAAATWNGVSDGAGWVWRHGGEWTWDNIGPGGAWDACTDDVTSLNCASNGLFFVFKPLKAAEKGVDAVDGPAKGLWRWLTKQGDDTSGRSPSNIGPNKTAGDDARDRIRDQYPLAKIEQTQTTPFGSRRIDVLTDDLTAIESKVGRTSLTTVTEKQILKDKWLLDNERVEDVQWIFSKSAVTGKIGPTPSLRKALDDAGIAWTVEP